MPERLIRNKNLRSSVAVIKEQPDLNALGRAGRRLKIDGLLMSAHGQTETTWRRLKGPDLEILRQIARKEDPAMGVSHQMSAIDALGQVKDKAALLQLSELSQNRRADLRLRLSATHSLGLIGGEQARPVLRGLLKDKTDEVRAVAAVSLGRAGRASDLAALEALAKEDKTFVKDVAQKAAVGLETRLRLR